MKSKSFLKDYHLLKRVFARRWAKSICSRFSADIKMSPAKNGSDKKHGAMRHPSLLCLLITWLLPPSKRHTVHRWIFCQKNLFFPGQQKNCEKISPFFTFRSGKLSKIALFWEKLSRLAFLGGKLQKFANLGVKIEIIG